MARATSSTGGQHAPTGHEGHHGIVDAVGDAIDSVKRRVGGAVSSLLDVDVDKAASQLSGYFQQASSVLRHMEANVPHLPVTSGGRDFQAHTSQLSALLTQVGEKRTRAASYHVAAAQAATETVDSYINADQANAARLAAIGGGQ